MTAGFAISDPISDAILGALRDPADSLYPVARLRLCSAFGDQELSVDVGTAPPAKRKSDRRLPDVLVSPLAAAPVYSSGTLHSLGEPRILAKVGGAFFEEGLFALGSFLGHVVEQGGVTC